MTRQLSEISTSIPKGTTFCRTIIVNPRSHVLQIPQWHQVFLVQSGLVWVETQGQRWSMQAPWVALIKRGTTITVETKTAATLTIVDFDNCVAEVPDTWTCRTFPADELLTQLFCHATRWDGMRTLDHMGAVFFQTLSLICLERARVPMSFSLPVGKSESIRRAMAFTQENLDNPLSRTEVANRAGLSTRTLTRHFRNEVGMSWRQYLRTLRMFRAAQLLAEEGPSISEICYAVGFENHSAFTRSFEAFYGQTPTQYRRRISKG